MENMKISFIGPSQVDVQRETFESGALGSHEVIVRKLYSLISPATELACLSGKESWFRMPAVPGYASVSEVVEKGAAVTDFEIGDIVFHYGKHCLIEKTTTQAIFIKVPPQVDIKKAPFTRMATVAFTAIRTSQIELGDYVAVTGLGLIGNMAAQLARLQGATVIGVDLSDKRLGTALSCGLHAAINPNRGDVKEQLIQIAPKGVSTLIEATGVPQVAVDALPWIGSLGELILLGSPRGEHVADVTDVLNYCHLYGRGAITFKGAHEWRYPVMANPFVKHSLWRNSEIVFRLIQSGQLVIDPLISHILKPEQAPEAYEGLKYKKDEYNGVLFDWT